MTIWFIPLCHLTAINLEESVLIQQFSRNVDYLLLKARFTDRSSYLQMVGCSLRALRTHKIYPRRNQHTDFTKLCKSQGVSARCMGAIALLLAAALGVGVGEAQAQTAVCSNTPVAAERIECTTSDDVDIDIDVKDVTITTTGEFSHGLLGWHSGTGDVNIDVKDLTITTNGETAYGIYGLHQGTGDGDVNIDAQSVTVTTSQNSSGGVFGLRNDAGDGDVNIEVKDGTITTNGETTHGIYGFHKGTGDVNIDAQSVTVTTSQNSSDGVLGFRNNAGDGDVNIEVKDGAITTTGNNTHGVVGHQLGLGTTGSIDIVVNGGTILASGMHASGVQVGRINSETNAVEDAAEVGDDGYRRQSVTVNGRVFGGTGEGAGVFLAGGGKVIIGPNGSVGAESGVAIRAARQDPTETAPKLHLTLNPGGRRIARVLDDDYIVNDGGQTHILFNGVVLHHGDDGNTGYVAPNGAFDVTLKDEDEGVVADGISLQTTSLRCMRRARRCTRRCPVCCFV